MKIDTGNLTALAPELYAVARSTKFVVHAGGKAYSGEADLSFENGVATLAFADLPPVHAFDGVGYVDEHEPPPASGGQPE